jgi:hypothetical protein
VGIIMRSKELHATTRKKLFVRLSAPSPKSLKS